jgi:hypothetical protein
MLWRSQLVEWHVVTRITLLSQRTETVWETRMETEQTKLYRSVLLITRAKVKGY